MIYWKSIYFNNIFEQKTIIIITFFNVNLKLNLFNIVDQCQIMSVFKKYLKKQILTKIVAEVYLQHFFELRAVLIIRQYKNS